MVRSIVVIVLFLSQISLAQQTGDFRRNYSINGLGAGGTSPVANVIAVPSTVVNLYETLDPNRPVAWVASTVLTVGWHTTQWNSVDIGPAPLIVLGNGADPADPFANFFRTNAGGSMTVSIPVPAALAGQAFYFAMAHTAPSSGEGFWVSQTHAVAFTIDPSLSSGDPTPNPAAQAVALTDDSFAAVSLGFPFPFYGTAYSSAFIGSNGYITFGSGDSSLGESISAHVSGQPRISMWWDDLNPASGGSVRFYTDGAGLAEASFASVPEYSSTGSNSFKATLFAGTAIALDYGAMTAVDGLVGLSPGGSVAPSLALNLSAAPNFFPPGVYAPCQLFDFATPNDLAGYQVLFILDASGVPHSQF